MPQPPVTMVTITTAIEAVIEVQTSTYDLYIGPPPLIPIPELNSMALTACVTEREAYITALQAAAMSICTTGIV